MLSSIASRGRACPEQELRQPIPVEEGARHCRSREQPAQRLPRAPPPLRERPARWRGQHPRSERVARPCRPRLHPADLHAPHARGRGARAARRRHLVGFSWGWRGVDPLGERVCAGQRGYGRVSRSVLSRLIAREPPRGAGVPSLTGPADPLRRSGMTRRKAGPVVALPSAARAMNGSSYECRQYGRADCPIGKLPAAATVEEGAIGTGWKARIRCSGGTAPTLSSGTTSARRLTSPIQSIRLRRTSRCWRMRRRMRRCRSRGTSPGSRSTGLSSLTRATTRTAAYGSAEQDVCSVLAEFSVCPGSPTRS